MTSEEKEAAIIAYGINESVDLAIRMVTIGRNTLQIADGISPVEAEIIEIMSASMLEALKDSKK